MSDKAKGIIDLSYEAANAIGLILDGRTEVTIRVVTAEEH
jgi:rare lipoprotein A (peptidoglycan hydrolase)